MLSRAVTTCLLLLLPVLLPTAARAALNGLYTVNPALPASATNYQSLTSAADDLRLGTRTDGGPVNGPGVSGPVTLQVAAGTYTGRLYLGTVPGVSAVNTLTLDGQNAANCRLLYAGATPADAVVEVDACDYVRLLRFTIQNTANGGGVALRNGADYAEVRNCEILMPGGGASMACGIANGIGAGQGGAQTAGMRIRDNRIQGGGCGIALMGLLPQYSAGAEVTGNTVEDPAQYAFYGEYLQAPLIERNTFGPGTSTASIGVRMQYCNIITLNRNRIYGMGQTGIYLTAPNSSAFSRCRVTNNVIGGGFRTTTSSHFGIYVSDPWYMDFWGNTVLVDGTTTGRCIYFSGIQLDLDIRNNLLECRSPVLTSQALFGASTGITRLDYNNYRTQGGNLVFLGTNYSSLAALQGAFPAFNANSRTVTPQFVSASDLHIQGPGMDDWGDVTVPNAVDYDGDSRPLGPGPAVDVGADEHRIFPQDLDIAAILSPLTGAPGPQTVTVSLVNMGTASLNGLPFTLQYSTNGGTTWAVTQAFSSTRLGSWGDRDTFSFSTPWTLTGPGPWNLCVRLQPSVPGDPDGLDQVCGSFCAGISGTFTLNPALPNGGSNFASYAQMVSALTACGISGPVTVNIAPGIRAEQVVIPALPGSGPGRILTLQGSTTGTTVLTAGLTQPFQDLLLLDGADYVRIRNIEFRLDTALNGSAIHLMNAADHNEITGCTFRLNPSLTAPEHAGVRITGYNLTTAGNHGNYTSITQNRFLGGYYGIRLNGTSPAQQAQGNEIRDNEFQGQYYYGVYAQFQQGMALTGNRIAGDLSFSFISGYGFYGSYLDGPFDLSGNIIHSVGARALYLQYGNLNLHPGARIQNNMLGANFFTNTAAHALSLLHVKQTGIFGNSCSLDYMNGYACYLGAGCKGLELRGNIFAADGDTSSIGYAWYVVADTCVAQASHNDLYSSGSRYITYNGSSYLDLPTFQLAYPLASAACVDAEPRFRATTDLHITCGLPLTASGLTLPGMSTDVDGDLRGSPPDMGADEFQNRVVSISLGPDTAHCGPMPLSAPAGWLTYFWSNGDYTAGTLLDSSGTWTLAVTDTLNCIARDTLQFTLLTAPAAPFPGPQLLSCTGDSLDAGAGAAAYLWNDGSTDQYLVPPSPGPYSVTVTDASGCTVADTVQVSLTQALVADLGPDTSFCLGGSAILDAGFAQWGDTYLWSTGATTQVLGVSASGLYSVTVTTPAGCTATDSILLNGLPSPLVSLGADRTLCDGGSLDALNPGFVWQWSTGASTQTIPVTQSGLYAVTVTHPNGCTGTDAVQITVSPSPAVNLGPDQEVCNGQTLVLDAGNPGALYQWSSGEQTQTLGVTFAGTWAVTVTDPQSLCVGNDLITVSQSGVAVNLGPDQYLCTQASITLHAGSGGTAWLWEDGSTGQDRMVTQPGTYSVAVSSPFSACVARDTVEIYAGAVITPGFTWPLSLPMLQPISFTNTSVGANAWTWDFGDGQSSSQQNPTHSYAFMGMVQVCLTATDGFCDSTVCHWLTIGPPIGVDPAGLAAQVQVWPNPTAGPLRVDPGLRGEWDLALTDMQGRVLETWQAHTGPLELDMRALPDGLYVLRIRAGEEQLSLRVLKRS